MNNNKELFEEWKNRCRLTSLPEYTEDFEGYCLEAFTAGRKLEIKTTTSLFNLIYEIRVAAGDPEGKLMQDELVEKIKKSCSK